MIDLILALILTGAPPRPLLTPYETQGTYIAACEAYGRTGNEDLIAVEIGGREPGYIDCDDYAEDILREPAFRAWYATIAKRRGLSPDPDDRRHCYDYRGFYRAMLAGQVREPSRRERFPSYWETTCHERT